MKTKKETKNEKTEKSVESENSSFGEVKGKEDLRAFLLGLRDKMEDGTAAPIYAVSAMNYVMNLPNIYEWLDNESKEVARDIWLRIKQAGLQLRSPALLFEAEENNKPA